MIENDSDKIEISLKMEIDDSYNLFFGIDLFKKIAEDLSRYRPEAKYAIITDSNVGPLYADNLAGALKNKGLETNIFSFNAGEKNKNIAVCLEIINKMSQLKYGRDSVVLALGGGVVGDMAGFVASIFNRGVPYIQIPTTVLAQADSSIGGKTAVNTEYGKNLIGIFKQPKAVYIDISTLETLSDRDFRSGLAETVKHGVIGDKNFFEFLQDNAQAIISRNQELSLDIAKNNCRIKGGIVEIDHSENGLRMILNYGHTIGHAIEKLSINQALNGNPSYLLHGEAISIGMMVAGRISQLLGYFNEDDLKAQEQLLISFGLPTIIPAEISDEAIMEITVVDKKSLNSRARYVLPASIGKMCDFNGDYAIYVDDQIVLRALKNTR